MALSLIHLEHAMPPLAELGLEHLVPIFLAGGKVGLDSETISRLMTALSDGAQKHSVRRLVAIAQATGEDLLGWEVESAKEADAQRAAALMSLEEVKAVVSGFFASCGLSLDLTPASLAPVEGSPTAENLETPPAES